MVWWTIFLRTVLLYLFVMLVMRMMGKREIGKLSILDLIVSFMIADISVIVIEDESVSLLKGIIPIATLVILQVILSYLSLKSTKMRRFIDGNPFVVIKNGKIQDRDMARSRYNLDDLLMQLRDKNIPDVADVEFAILETSGKLSVFPKKEKSPLTIGDLPKNHSLKPFSMPTPMIIEGKVQEEGLKKIGKTRFWLKNEIQKKGYKDFKEIYYASINDEGKLFIDRKDNKEE
ncbi:uncharacterized membrane protein YcaP (DUF421 family) [Hazenella coriacea]|uniref:Uncharacterized membrane protein YcaP (DUF421 family) n=2 Tax=Hazenella coriacea TaxID=1179467 RepID=A0A4R3L9S0_9BACL|nr:DUF421 domain-containing protein [Hazenella coriacea]TCS96459.1 uncharacterized membrane protein YcaP (DUF421 family) [Hazenella coriacea]